MKRMLLLAPALVVSALAAAQTPPAAKAGKPDVARGQQIVTEICAACHGQDGNSPTPVNPSLASQHADYITLQLTHYKSGVRANPVMQGIAQQLGPEDMRSLGAYFAQQKATGQSAKDAALVRTGQSIWRGGDAASGVPACSACHLPNGAGVPKNYPRIAGQHADYTLKQLQLFRSGERGLDKEGKDVNGRIMREIANAMSEEQMRAVSEYAAGLR
jgi:cytochrome c553